MRQNWREAPFVDLPELVGDEPLLVLAPHADDETIGCGGLIQQAVRGGRPVFIDILTDGSRSHPNSMTHGRARLVALRQDEAQHAVERLGIDRRALEFWGQDDSRLDADDAVLIERVRRRIADTAAGSLFVTWIDDPHCDHKAAFALALKAVQGMARPPRLYGYPVWSWTVATSRHQRERCVVRLDIASDLVGKREALACHASQLGKVIEDDPTGFSLSEAEVALFTQPQETFILVDTA